ncbi:hypothetical protein CI109_104812 [Kwoniella shandongensis]|uniref:Uncharacterized protein n=1 Tax=Kwoniella shandongensis TaxID=1734106 RepID=A0A5M6BVE6_9TREE|nr:uncharacterized protein CI109_006206 [Kwoniella shandongensis]KAA5525515.1 hypothetical protein CI109_006206 [Kwoniella shandongensis]
MDDDDFEDLLRDTGDPDVVLEDSPVKASNTLSSKNQNHTESMAMPSENELRLGRRVLELEKERDALGAEIIILKARLPPPTPTIPIPASTTSSANTEPIEIPPALLPLLAALRTHIAELTRDNQALRFTFLGHSAPRRREGPIRTGSGLTPVVATSTTVAIAPPAQVASMKSPAGGIASSSKMTLDVPMTPSLSDDSKLSPTTTTSTGAPTGAGSGEMATTTTASSFRGVDLDKVVERVKELVLENEELGEMVLEAGRAGNEAWEKALEESKAVIASLDSDLTHHLSLVQSLRAELSTYKPQAHVRSTVPDSDRFTSLEATTSKLASTGFTSPTGSIPSAPRASIRGAAAGGRGFARGGRMSGVPAAPRSGQIPSQSGGKGMNGNGNVNASGNGHGGIRILGQGQGQGGEIAQRSSPGPALGQSSTQAGRKEDERGYKRRR